ncbi:MAG: hypothetical protein GY710_16035 [Desulfobacteraceae bacterium]|nr:hypothetical protein [Desulfobacteraceae bacterium]
METSIYHDNPTLEFINESEFEYANRNQEDDLTSPAIDATSFSDKLKNIYTNKSEHIILEDLELILNESKGKAIIKKGNPIEFFKEDIQKIEKICQTNIDECLIAAFIY